MMDEQGIDLRVYQNAFHSYFIAAFLSYNNSICFFPRSMTYLVLLHSFSTTTVFVFFPRSMTYLVLGVDHLASAKHGYHLME